MKDRGLKVRGLTWIFDQVTCRQIRPTSVTGWGITYNIAFLFQAPWVHVEATVYGARDGTLPGWACTSKDIHNIFKNSRLMKSGCVHEVKMLGRQDFFKPEATQQIRQMLLAFMTDIYIYIYRKQYLHVLQKTCASLTCMFLLTAHGSPKASPRGGGSSLPHLGRAMTDIQEMKQVPWQ